MSFFQEVGQKLSLSVTISLKYFNFFVRNTEYSIHASQFKARKFIGMHESETCKVNGERIDHIQINACRWHAGTSELLCEW